MCTLFCVTVGGIYTVTCTFFLLWVIEYNYDICKIYDVNINCKCISESECIDVVNSYNRHDSMYICVYYYITCVYTMTVNDIVCTYHYC